MNGTLQTRAGRSTLRIERRLAHSPEKVWRALADPTHINQCFPFDVELDLKAGSKIKFIEKSGEGPPSDGVITELDPPRLIAYSWGDDLLHWELQPDGKGCLLIFTHTFDDRAGAASFAAGWQVCLDALALVVAGEPIDAAQYTGTDWSRQMAALHEAYIDALGLSEGSTEETSDGWRVRFERQLTQPIDKVWTLITEGNAPEVGGPTPQAFATGKVTTGVVTAVTAPALLEYEWQFAGRPAGFVRWELGAGTGHGARLILTQTGPRELADQQRIALAAWQEHIERFAKELLDSLA